MRLERYGSRNRSRIKADYETTLARRTPAPRPCTAAASTHKPQRIDDASTLIPECRSCYWSPNASAVVVCTLITCSERQFGVIVMRDGRRGP